MCSLDSLPGVIVPTEIKTSDPRYGSFEIGEHTQDAKRVRPDIERLMAKALTLGDSLRSRTKDAKNLDVDSVEGVPGGIDDSSQKV